MSHTFRENHNILQRHTYQRSQEEKVLHVNIRAESQTEEANGSFELHANTGAKPGKELV